MNTFSRGIHPPGNKYLSRGSNITVMPAPAKVYIPLSQHIGKSAVPLVKAGDAVKKGTLIARAEGSVSANVFSSVSGKVIAEQEKMTASGYAKHIVIENDFSNEEFTFEPLDNPSCEQIIERVREAGIVGMGGAGFPTAIKLSPDSVIDTYIINAAECEPYITCDYRIILDYTEQFVRGSLLLAKAVGLNRVIIAVEDNKQDAANHLHSFITKNGINAGVVVVKTKYPQGAEKQLIYALTQRIVETGKLPSSVGVLVSNVHTALSTYLAVHDGQPLYKRVMTVTGEGVKKPSNIWVANGTTYKDIIEYCGGYGYKETVKIINGGPMMGLTVPNDDIASTKTTSCLLLLSPDEAFCGSPAPCINCGKCARVCPMKLMPMFIDAYALCGDMANAAKYGAKSCIECGSCAYICPAKRPLVQSIRLAKKKLKSGGRE